jgi:hypothetical protein
MADLADAEDGLANLVTSVCYPTGNAAPSVFGNETDIFRGWPTKQNLDPALKNGTNFISVYLLPGFSRETTRYRKAWKQIASTAPTITVAIDKFTATFSGAAGIQQTAGIRFNGVVYSVAATITDTPDTVAAALAALVPGASVAGSVVTVPCFDPHFEAKTGGYGTAMLELAREIVGIKVTLWTPSVEMRDLVGRTLRAALANYDYFPLADGSNGRLKHTGGFVDDRPSKSSLWVRDLRYTVEFPTTQVITAPLMSFGQITATQHSDPTRRPSFQRNLLSKDYFKWQQSPPPSWLR